MQTEFFSYDESNRLMYGPFPSRDVASILGIPIECPKSPPAKKTPWGFVVSELKCRKCDNIVGEKEGCDWCKNFKVFAAGMNEI